jgi:outer membrane receptor protein involved in Fe transport
LTVDFQQAVANPTLPMNTPLTLRPSVRVAVIVVSLWLGAQARAQAVAPPPAPKPPTIAASGSGEVVALSAFEVQADPDNSYGALNSVSITRFAVEMEKMPVSADIFTETFMKDIAATSVEDVIMGYSAGAGFASGTDNGVATGAANQPGDRVGNAYIQLRGMNTPAMQRDGFMPVGAFGNPGSTAVGRTDNFDLERVEVINGPQALLYGGGGAGGVINVSSKQARFSTTGSAFTRPKGEALYRLDRYGSKRGQLDFGFGNRWVATRLAFMRESTSSRRVNIGGTTDGQYGQLAFRLLQTSVPTTIRLSASGTMNRRRLATGPTLTATAADTRNGMNLHYILATHQEGDTNPITGARYAAGAILGGKLNWSNVDSFGAGYAYQNPISNQFYSGTIDTKWNDWLTTQIAGGYDNFTERRINPGFSFFAPNSGANNTANWAAGETPSDSWQPARTKGGRVAALITKNLWGNRAKTQTLFGADYIRTDFGQIGYNWYQADANWNPIIAPGSTITSANSGRTPLGQLRWSINDGPVLYPFADPSKDRAVYNGLNYVRALNNQPQANLRTLANPHGVPFTSGNYIITKIFNQGFYGMNYTQWFDGKLSTLAGVRTGKYISDRLQHPSGTGEWLTIAKRTNFNVGVDYSINRWLSPYINYSDSVEPPFLANSADPYGNPPASSHGVGGDVGVKFNLPPLGVSGSLAWFKNSAKAALYNINGNITSEINPAGLNGGGGSSNVNVDRVTSGMELRLTASPMRNWRIRFSAATQDGKIGTAKAYDQLYNDQFYASAAGVVTYKDGTPVFVNGGTTAVVSTAANATPLTITSMSTPGNTYFANPDPISGRINTSAVVANILRGTGDTAAINARGPILTGAIMLPISQLQLNKTLAGINTPGTIVATRVGDKTTGYAERSVNFTNLYTFSGDNFLRGVQLGGTVSASWKNRRYYYYATPVTAANALTLRRTLYYGPDQWQFDLIVGYRHKFGRYDFRTGLNVNNLFNHYLIQVLPNATTGFNTITSLNATWYQQPRTWQWTNSLSF